MDGEGFRADSPVDFAPGVQLTDEQKADHARAKEAGWSEKTAFDYGEHDRARADDRDWGGAGKVYEWNPEEYGEVGPAIPELEAILFHGEFQQRKGEHMGALDLSADIDGPTKPYVRKVSERVC